MTADLVFSIVIPCLNRSQLLRRAVHSCYIQDFKCFEIIIVDDGSTDADISLMPWLLRPRLKIIRHERNRGVGPARNTGCRAAMGEWVIFLDSDDELAPGALSVINQRSLELHPDTQRMLFMGRLDSGDVSPAASFQAERWDYIRYIEFMEQTFGRAQDALPVIRRESFSEVRFADDRSLEALYHLTFMKRFTAQAFPDVVAAFHQDAPERLSSPSAEEILVSSHDQWCSTRRILDEHGEALRLHAPRIYSQLLSGMVTLSLLTGRRGQGFRYATESVRHGSISTRTLITLAMGLISRRQVARAKAWVNKRRAKG